MSTLKVDNLLNSAGNESPISVPGAAKAWINFDGSGTISIRNSYNVSTITDNGTGNYTITFTNNLPSADFCVQLSATDDGSTSGQTDGYAYGCWLRGSIAAAFTTSTFRLRIGYPANTSAYDQSHIMVTVFHD